MHIFVFLWVFMSLFLWLFLYDAYDICMHDYMMMHVAVYFLYVMIDVPLKNVISHLICYAIEISGNMHEWND